MTDDFVRDLEDELIAAARFRAAHAPRIAYPRRGLVIRALAFGVAATLAVIAVLAMVRGGTDDPRAGGRPAPPPGTACTEVAPELKQRVAVLAEPVAPGRTLPPAALDAAAEWRDFGAAVPHGARFWGGDDGVEFWAVPAVPRGAADCVPATAVCIVAVDGDRADAICGPGPAAGAVQWRMSLFAYDRTAIFGLVPEGAAGVEVELGDRVTEIEARRNVFGGVLPFAADPADNPAPKLLF
jgi:hypothetical protein